MTPDLVVRPYAPGDRDIVRHIVCTTAFRNRGHTAMVDDAELFADYWSRYYTDYEPASCLVAEREGAVVGALLGTLDTRRFQRVMATHIVPSVLGRLLMRLARGRLHGTPTGRFLRWTVRHAWREAPAIDLARFPAHYHANVLRAGYRASVYTSLAAAFVRRAREAGVPGIHGQVLDRAEGGAWDSFISAFRTQHPEVPVTSTVTVSTMGHAVWNDPTPMVNGAVGMATADFLTFLEWLRRWRHL